MKVAERWDEVIVALSSLLSPSPDNMKVLDEVRYAVKWQKRQAADKEAAQAEAERERGWSLSFLVP